MLWSLTCKYVSVGAMIRWMTLQHHFSMIHAFLFDFLFVFLLCTVFTLLCIVFYTKCQNSGRSPTCRANWSRWKIGIFQIEIFLAASGRARSGRSKNMLISGFWDIWLSARRVFGRIWILQILATTAATAATAANLRRFEIRGSIFLYNNTCARARRRKQPRVNSFGKKKTIYRLGFTVPKTHAPHGFGVYGSKKHFLGFTDQKT